MSRICGVHRRVFESCRRHRIREGKAFSLVMPTVIPDLVNIRRGQICEPGARPMASVFVDRIITLSSESGARPHLISPAKGFDIRLSGFFHQWSIVMFRSRFRYRMDMRETLTQMSPGIDWMITPPSLAWLCEIFFGRQAIPQ
jgi:hypothetical protein